MKRFQQYMAESPNETVSPVSVSKYFKHPPDVSWQPIIPKVIEAVKSGALIATKQDVPIASLIPTQKTVSQAKVDNYKVDAVSSIKTGIALHTEHAMFLLDGHHRACSDAVRGLAKTPLRVLSIQQLNDWLTKSGHAAK